MSNYTIPMTGANNVPAINSNLTMSGEARIPLSAKPFTAYDPVKNAAEALELDESVENFKAKQQERFDLQKAREEKDRDKQILGQYLQSGGDLYTPEGVETALNVLKDKISVPAYDNLGKMATAKKKLAAEMRNTLSNAELDEIKALDAKQDQTLQMLSTPLTAYETAAKQRGEPAALEEFKAAKGAIIQELSQQKDVGGGTRYSPAMLQKFDSMSPEQLRNEVANTKWMRGIAKDEMERKVKEAQADYYKAGADQREAKAEKPLTKIGQLRKAAESGEISSEEAEKLIATELNKTGEGFDKEDAEKAAEAIASYRLKPLGAFAMRTPYGQHVMARVTELNSKYDAKQYDVVAKAEKDFATGKQGNTVRSFNVAIDHLSTLDSLVDALNNGDYKLINKAANIVAEQTGSTAPTNFDAAKKIVADEIVKAIVGSGGALADREETARVISRTNSPAQLKEVIKTYKELMRGQLGGLKVQYKASTGRDDFDERYLTDEARAVSKAKRHSGGPEDFPKVDPETQNGRDVEAGKLRVQEMGGVDAAKREVQQIDASLRSAKGDARRILEREKKLYEAGIQALGGSTVAAGKQPAAVNPKGWKLYKDKNGNMAYVGPNGQFEEVKNGL